MNQFKEYVQKMNEVRASDIGAPSPFNMAIDKVKNFLGHKTPDRQTESEINLIRNLAQYYHFNVNTEKGSDIDMAIKQGNVKNLNPSEQALIQVARAMLSSKGHLTNYKPTALTRGVIQAFLDGVGDPKLIDSKESGPEAMAVSLGHLAHGMGMQINLDSGFSKQVQEYYNNMHRTQKYQNRMTRKGIAGTAEVLSKQLTNRNAKIDLGKAIMELIKKYRDDGDEDTATDLIQFYRGLGL